MGVEAKLTRKLTPGGLVKLGWGRPMRVTGGEIVSTLHSDGTCQTEVRFFARPDDPARVEDPAAGTVDDLAWLLEGSDRTGEGE